MRPGLKTKVFKNLLIQIHFPKKRPTRRQTSRIQATISHLCIVPFYRKTSVQLLGIWSKDYFRWKNFREVNYQIGTNTEFFQIFLLIFIRQHLTRLWSTIKKGSLKSFLQFDVFKRNSFDRKKREFFLRLVNLDNHANNSSWLPANAFTSLPPSAVSYFP